MPDRSPAAAAPAAPTQVQTSRRSLRRPGCTHEYVQVPGPEIWIGFSTLAQLQFGEDFHTIYIYFSDPALVDRPGWTRLSIGMKVEMDAATRMNRLHQERPTTETNPTASATPATTLSTRCTPLTPGNSSMTTHHRATNSLAGD
jgi:hypothetical protein